jgi:threonylcarbamoyladenosine tRNA methylthiotransferase MtaB
MKIFLDTVGCRLNQSEIEHMAAQFRAAGHVIVPGAAEADMVVVNTCAVTNDAAADSRQAIRHAARAGVGRIVATGCWATLDPLNAAALPSVVEVVQNDQKDHLVSSLLHVDEGLLGMDERQAVPGDHSRTRAFLKVQDGCDNACTFCITHIARGRGRSRLIEDIVREVKLSLAGGTKEVVLTGVHLGSWGQDLTKPLHLSRLVEAILARTDVPRLRLSSLEPWDLESSFFDLWQDDRLCPHFHLPLQSGSASVLKRMARKTTPAGYQRLVEQIYEQIPGAAVTTDLIAGFPGEGPEEFGESAAFVKKMQFAGGHVFYYSARPGTAAARFGGQIPMKVRKQRSAEMRLIFAEMGQAYRQQFIGRQMTVLWESAQKQVDGSWAMEGLTGNYLRVQAVTRTNLWNQISRVALHQVTSEGMSGEITDY